MAKVKQLGNLSLTGYDELFANTTPIPATGQPIDTTGERVVEIPLEELHPPEFHPFQVNDDAEMERLSKSVKQYGVREPGIIRPRVDGGYELVSGNRRKRACELAELPTMPVIIREMDDNDAAILMVE